MLNEAAVEQAALDRHLFTTAEQDRSGPTLEFPEYATAPLLARFGHISSSTPCPQAIVNSNRGLLVLGYSTRAHPGTSPRVNKALI